MPDRLAEIEALFAERYEFDESVGVWLVRDKGLRAGDVAYLIAEVRRLRAEHETPAVDPAYTGHTVVDERLPEEDA